MTKPIPEGYRNVNVILTVDDAKGAIDFYKKAFGATEISRLPMGDKIGHAELQVGDNLRGDAGGFGDGHARPSSPMRHKEKPPAG